MLGEVLLGVQWREHVELGSLHSRHHPRLHRVHHPRHHHTWHHAWHGAELIIRITGLLREMSLKLLHVFLRHEEANLTVSGLMKLGQFESVTSVSQLFEVLMNRQFWGTSSLLVLIY